MWNHSIVKMSNFFFWNFIICIILIMFPKECMCSVKCCAYFEALLLYWKERLCSLNLVLKSRSVCPMYAFPQSEEVNFVDDRMCKFILVADVTS